MPHAPPSSAARTSAAHACQLRVGRAPVIVADDEAADGARADHARDVDRRAVRVDPAQEPGDIAEVELDALRAIAVARLGEPGIVPAYGVAILPGDLGGHTLTHLALGARVTQQYQFRVRVDVDEAGCECEAVQIELAIATNLHAQCEFHDASAGHCDIRARWRTAGAVVDECAAQHEVRAGAGVARSQRGHAADVSGCRVTQAGCCSAAEHGRAPDERASSH
jgi:hypothetical protein